MPELCNWSASKIWHVLSTKKPKIVTKRPPVATTGPSGMNSVIGALVYWGKHSDRGSDLRSRHEEPHHLPGALLPPVTNKFTIYDYILRLRQKRCDF